MHAAETPLSLLNRQVTPVETLSTENDDGSAAPWTADPDDWRLRIDGEVDLPLDLNLGELQRRFPVVSLQLQVECGPTISNCVWTGIRLRDVLEEAELRPGAVLTLHYSGHRGSPDGHGVPIAKAVEKHTLLALAVNGGPLPNVHGHPVRLIYPGWPASAGARWLSRIEVGGSEVRGIEMVEPMPVRSILTSHESGTRLAAGTREIELRGSAWAGDREAAAVHVSLDRGITWAEMLLDRPVNRFAWQRWTGRVALPSDGCFEVWVRATDDAGNEQPMATSPRGDAGNAIGRINLLVG